MTKDQVFNTKSESGVRPSEVGVQSGSKFIGATFLYLTLALLVTFAVVGIMGALFKFAIYDENPENLSTFIYIFFGALVVYIPVMIWVHIAARGGRTIGPAFFTYSIVMGALIAPICVLFDFWTIIIALGSTVTAFAVMALIAWTSKKNLSVLGIIGMGLLMGAFLLSIFNLIFYLVLPSTYQLIYPLVSGLFFIAILLLTVFDLNNVKRIAMSGNASKNLAFMCALNLYVDFIYIFIRILRIVAVLFANRR